MALDHGQYTGSPHLPPAEESHHQGRPREKREMDTDRPGRRTARRDAVRTRAGRAHGARGADGRGATPGRRQPRVSLWRLLLSWGLSSGLCVHPSSSRLPGAAALPTLPRMRSEVAARIMSRGNGQMRRTILWKPRRGLCPHSPRTAAAAVTIETPPPPTLPADSPPLPEQRDSRHKGARGLGGRGDTRGVARPLQTWRGSAARAAAPASCGARPALGLTGPPGTPAAPERGQTDGRTAVAGAGTAAAGAGGGGAAADPLRHNAAGRPPAPLPRPPKGRAGGGRPEAAEPEPARRTLSRAHRERGRGRRCRPGCWSHCAHPAPRARRPPPAREPLADSALPPAPGAAPAPPPRRLLTATPGQPAAPVREPALSSPPSAPASAAPASPPLRVPSLPLSPLPSAPTLPTWRPRPLAMQSPLTGIRAPTAATSLVPRPFQAGSLHGGERWPRRGRAWARSWETAGLPSSWQRVSVGTRSPAPLLPSPLLSPTPSSPTPSPRTSPRSETQGDLPGRFCAQVLGDDGEGFGLKGWLFNSTALKTPLR